MDSKLAKISSTRMTSSARPEASSARACWNCSYAWMQIISTSQSEGRASGEDQGCAEAHQAMSRISAFTRCGWRPTRSFRSWTIAGWKKSLSAGGEDLMHSKRCSRLLNTGQTKTRASKSPVLAPSSRKCTWSRSTLKPAAPWSASWYSSTGASVSRMCGSQRAMPPGGSCLTKSTTSAWGPGRGASRPLPAAPPRTASSTARKDAFSIWRQTARSRCTTTW
mmetsp:Transcript_77190/g.218444  ORF Transcript_77190/g.218444 Transcript_77190/m.218444 type:complete len:222 (-) Transcript_77190:931-1596(-)